MGNLSQTFNKCPVCGNPGRAWGKKTCGAPECIKEWRTWGADTKIKALRMTEWSAEQQLEYARGIEEKLAERDTTDAGTVAEDEKIITEHEKAQEHIANILGPVETALSEQEQREIRRKQMLESVKPKEE